MNLKDYVKIQEALEQAKEDYNRREGSLSHLKEQLRREYSCKNLDEAETMLNKLVREVEKEAKAMEKSIEAFERKWCKGKL